LHLTPPSSLRHLLISENDDDDDNGDGDDDEDDDNDAADDDDVDDDNVDDDDNPDDLFPMAKTAPKKRGAAAVGKKVAPKKKTTGEETIDLDTPPRKKPRAAAARYSIEKRGCYTVNPLRPPLEEQDRRRAPRGWRALQGCPAPGLPPTWREDTERPVEDVGEALLRASGLGAGHRKGLLPLHGVLRHHARVEEGGSRPHRRLLQGTSSDY
jgi:hypothetical protein